MDKNYKDSAIYLMDIIGQTNKVISNKVQKIMNEEKNISNTINSNIQKHILTKNLNEDIANNSIDNFKQNNNNENLAETQAFDIKNFEAANISQFQNSLKDMNNTLSKTSFQPHSNNDLSKNSAPLKFDYEILKNKLKNTYEEKILKNDFFKNISLKINTDKIFYYVEKFKNKLIKTFSNENNHSSNSTSKQVDKNLLEIKTFLFGKKMIYIYLGTIILCLLMGYLMTK